MYGPDRKFAVEELEYNITNHPPTTTDIVAAFEIVAANAIEFGTMILDNVPYSRERSLALTKLEEATQWARAGIARHQEMWLLERNHSTREE